MENSTLTEKKIKNIIAEVTGCGEKDIANNRPIIEIAGNSIHLLEIVARIEEEFKVTLDEDQMIKLHTVKDILKYIAEN